MIKRIEVSWIPKVVKQIGFIFLANYNNKYLFNELIFMASRVE